MGGHIECKSKVGQGTVFIITLSLKCQDCCYSNIVNINQNNILMYKKHDQKVITSLVKVPEEKPRKNIQQRNRKYENDYESLE